MRKAFVAVALSAMLQSTGGATAQVYPSRPITMAMPFAAGGSGDTIARLLAERMRAPLGQPVIVENLTGAGGSLGTGRVARAAPDGYTIILGSWATHVVNPAVHPLTYDVVEDFAPVSMVATQPLVILSKKALPANNLQELIAWLKANPDHASQGTAGAGTATHIAGVFFQRETGTRFQFVPYRGSNPSMQDMIAGQIDLMIDATTNSLPHVRAGTIKGYAVTAKSRTPAAPDLPSVDEAGLPGFHISQWNGLFAPKGTPKDVIAKLQAAMQEALADPAVRARLAGLGQEIYPREQQNPEALAAFHKAETEKWWPIIRAAGIKPEGR